MNCGGLARSVLFARTAPGSRATRKLRFWLGAPEVRFWEVCPISTDKRPCSPFLRPPHNPTFPESVGGCCSALIQSFENADLLVQRSQRLPPKSQRRHRSPKAPPGRRFHLSLCRTCKGRHGAFTFSHRILSPHSHALAPPRPLSQPPNRGMLPIGGQATRWPRSNQMARGDSPKNERAHPTQNSNNSFIEFHHIRRRLPRRPIGRHTAPRAKKREVEISP